MSWVTRTELWPRRRETSSMRRPGWLMAQVGETRPVEVVRVGGEGVGSAPGLAAVGDEEDLELPPPHLGPLRGRSGEGVDEGGGGDLGFGDGPPDRIGGGGFGGPPAHAAEHV